MSGARIVIRRIDGADLEEDELAELLALDAICFPGTARVVHEPADVRWWWRAEVEGVLVGFASARWHWDPNDSSAVFFTRAGVLPEWRGLGIHDRLIRRRVRDVKALGASSVFTYTATFNPKSANNLISQGFRVFWPDRCWFGTDVIYWRKELR